MKRNSNLAALAKSVEKIVIFDCAQTQKFVTYKTKFVF